MVGVVGRSRLLMEWYGRQASDFSWDDMKDRFLMERYVRQVFHGTIYKIRFSWNDIQEVSLGKIYKTGFSWNDI